jgi:hypothetical protein
MDKIILVIFIRAKVRHLAQTEAYLWLKLSATYF